MMITRCAGCPHYEARVVLAVFKRGESPTSGVCRFKRRLERFVADSTQQPDWCPLPEEDPNST